MVLARKFGTAVIALTIDEPGMAKTPERKLAVAERLVEFACTRHGLKQSRPADRPADLHHRHRQRGRPQARAEWTLQGIARDPCEKFPDVQIILGLSNISFGLNPGRARSA